LLLSVATKDIAFPRIGNLKWIEQDVRKVYVRENMPQNFSIYAFEGKHSLSRHCSRFGLAISR
jgi:hypothetical protein